MKCYEEHVCFAKLGVEMFIFASNGSAYLDIIAILYCCMGVDRR
jgi:hypothetical protein